MASKGFKTRQLVCEAFVALLADTPYHKITVTQLIARAGVSRTAFYNNFKSIDDVILLIYDYSFREGYGDKFSSPSYITSSAYIRDTIAYFDRFSVFLSAVEKQEVSQYFYITLARRLFSGLHSSDSFIMNNKEYFLAFFLSPVFHICQIWMTKGKKESREELQRICEELYERAHQQIMHAYELA